MKKILFLIAMTFIGLVHSQDVEDDFVIIDQGVMNNVEVFISAFKSVNWDKYRYINNRRVIKFESGVQFELLSANELESLNVVFDKTKAFEKPEKDMYEPVYSLTENGRIIEKHISISKRNK